MKSIPSPSKIPERLKSRLKQPGSHGSGNSQIPTAVQDNGAKCPKKDPDVFVRTKTFGGLRVVDSNKKSDSPQSRREQFRRNTPRRHTLAISSTDKKKDEEKPTRSAEELREQFKTKLMKRFPKEADNYYGEGPGSTASEEGYRMRPAPGKRHAARRRTTVVNYNPESSRSLEQDERCMSEIDTESLSSQGLQRGGSLRSSLPIVRSPNHSFDRSLGLVFLIYGDETKRGLLPNEVTHLDTVRALFVRSFPDKLNMPLLESRPQLKIYIQDSKSRVFYQLEDLRDIQETCILKLHYCDSKEPQRVKEYTKVRGKTILSPPRLVHSAKSPTYRGEHLQKNGIDQQTSLKTKSLPIANSNYHDQGKRPQQMRDLPEIRYRPLTPDVAHTSPDGRWRGPPTEEQRRMLPERPFSPDRLALGTIPENRQPSPGSKRHTSPRDLGRARSAQSTPTPMDGPSSGRSTPTASLAPQQYSKYRTLSPSAEPSARNQLPHRSPPGQFVRERTGYHSDGSPQVKHGPLFPPQAAMYVAKGVRATTYSTFSSPQRATAAPQPRDPDPRVVRDSRDPVADRSSARNSLVYVPTGIPPIPRQAVVRIPMDRGEAARRPQNLGPPNSVSDGQICQRSQSYRMPGDRSEMRIRPRSVTPQPSDYDPEAKFRIEKMEAQLANLTAWVHSTVVTNGSADGSRSSSVRSLTSGSGKSSNSSNTIVVHRYAQGLNDLSTACKQTQTQYQSRVILPKELSNGLLLLHKRTIELKIELKGIRRLHQLNMEGAQESIDEVYGKIKVALTSVPGVNNRPVRQKRLEVDAICDTFKIDKLKVQRELKDLESSVEEMRNDVISRQCRVNMSEVEGMALALSQIAKALAELKGRLPPLISSMKSVMAGEMEVVVAEEKFVKEEPDSVESCLRKCKKLTGTLFTMKRLASVQEQRPPQIPVLSTNPSGREKTTTVLENIQSMVPNHDARLQSLEAADASRERKKRLAAQQEALRFEKNLELATKNLKSQVQGRSSGSNSGRTTPEVDGKDRALISAGSSDKISNVGKSDTEGVRKVPRSQSLDPDDRDKDDPDSLSNQKMAARAEFFRSLRSASPPNLPKRTSKLEWVVHVPKSQPSSSSTQDNALDKPELSSPLSSPVSKLPGPSTRSSQSASDAPSSNLSPRRLPQIVSNTKVKAGMDDREKKKIPPPPPPRSSTRSMTQSQPSFSSLYSTICSPSKLDCSAAAADHSNMNIKSSREAGLPIASTPVVGAPKKATNNFEKGIMNVVYVNVHHSEKGPEESKPAAVKLNVVDNPTDNGNDQESDGESTTSVDSQHEVWRLRSDANAAKSGQINASRPKLTREEVKARKKPPPPPQRKSSVLSRRDLTDRLQDQTTKTQHLQGQHDKLDNVETQQETISKQHQILEDEQKQMTKGKKKT